MHDALMLLVKWTLTASGVGVAALAITPLLRRRYASWGIYALWLVVVAAFLVPLRLPARKDAVTLPVPQVITQPIALRPLQENTDVPTVQVALPYAADETAPELAKSAPAVTPAQAILAIYLLGAAFTLAWRLTRHLRFMRTVRRWSERVEEAEIRSLYARAKDDVGVRRGPELLHCEAVESPMLAGIVHPRILLPYDAPKGDALLMVLRHELVHYRRGDLALKLLAMAAQIAHWFNPVAHLAVRMLDVYCELSCDDQAMRRATMDERALYSQTILDALRRRPGTVSALTTNFSADKKTLKRRLTQIMDMHVKKRGFAFAVCAILLTLAIGTSFALADTKDASVWNAQPMTKAELLAICDESFEKMGTYSSVYYTEEEVVDQAELETWLADFEKRYTEQTGYARKEDLVVSSTPGANDMPYDEALKYAKQMIMDKYGTPEEELDAMGVYPRFLDFVYMEDESEWAFFFTPLTNCDIDEDHDYSGPGEYRAEFKARSGEEVLCLWYIDDFWPYAQRTWDAGKYDVVYEQFKKATFLTQEADRQAYFAQLLKEKGYDVEADRDVLSALNLQLLYAEVSDSVLLSGDAAVETALAAMQETYGLDRATLQACGYGAFYSPFNSGTTDVCFSYNYNLADQLMQSREGVTEAGTWQNLIAYYPSRLGSYMISLGPETGAVTATTHEKRNAGSEDAQDAKLLAKQNWTSEDAAAYLKLCDELIPAAVASAQPNYAEHEAAVHTLLREWGGSEDQFPACEPDEGEITYDQAVEIARQAVMEEEKLTEEEFSALYDRTDASYDYTVPAYHAYVFSYIIDGENAAPDYYALIDAKSGEILEFKIAIGNG